MVQVSFKAGEPGHDVGRSSQELSLTVASGFLLLFILLIAPRIPLVFNDAIMQTIMMVTVGLSGIYPLRRAWISVSRYDLTMDVVVGVVALGAVVLGAWLEGAVVFCLFSVMNLLEQKVFQRARYPLSRMEALIPDETIVWHNEAERSVPTVGVQPGDVCVVQPKARIPVDGKVTAGRSIVNQAAVTGESVPVEIGPGDRVYAGTANGPEPLYVVTERTAARSTLARMISFLKDGLERPPSIEDRIGHRAQVYTAAVAVAALGIAALPPIVWGEAFTPWLYRGLALLILSCPYALLIGTPLAITSALSNGARQGFLVHGGPTLEKLAEVDTVVFDQTGSLSKGHLHVTDVIPWGELSTEDILAVAAGVQWRSHHPIGSAIVAMARQKDVQFLPVESVHVQPGLGIRGTVKGRTFRFGNLRFLRRESVDVSGVKGRVEVLEAEGKTVVGLAAGLRVVGLIALADAPSEETARALKRITHVSGIDRLEIITPHEESARHLADQLNISHVRTAWLPEEKAEAVATLQQDGRRVALVADPMTDSEALAVADVGIAMGGADWDDTFPTADAIVMSDDLSKLSYALILARRTGRILRQNAWLVIGVHGLALFLIWTGDMTLWMAMFGHLLTSFIVSCNGLRLLRRVRISSVR